MVSSCRGDLRTDTEVAFVRLLGARRRQLVDVLDHFWASHPDASIDNCELVDATALKVELQPVYVPSDLALFLRELGNSLQAVLGELAQELKGCAVSTETVEHESHVVDSKEGGFSGGMVRHRQLLGEVGLRPLA